VPDEERVPVWLQSDFSLLRDLESIVDLDSEVPDRAFELGMAEKKLHCSKVLRSSVGQRGFGTSDRVRPIRGRIDAYHSISRVARTISSGAIVSLSALAVFMLITSSTEVGCSIGRSPGFAPFRIRST